LSSKTVVQLPMSLYACVDIINPNEVESEILTGVEIHSIADAERAAAALLERGPRVAVVKMGDRGASYLSRDGGGHAPAMAVKAADTTAAGDAVAAAVGVAAGVASGVAAAGALEPPVQERTGPRLGPRARVARRAGV